MQHIITTEDSERDKIEGSLDLIMNSPRYATVIGLVANSILFVAKFIVGLFSNSIAVLSDAFNSFTDIFSSAAIYVSVKISGKKADEDHQFGHRRAEPIAGLIVAIFAGILGFEVLKESAIKFFEPHPHSIGLLSIGVLIANIAVKVVMAGYLRHVGIKHNSPAVLAGSIDSRNDVLSTSVALIGVIGAYIGYPQCDEIAGIVIGGIIIWSGYRIGKENINYLMGKAADREVIEQIREKAIGVKGILGVSNIRTHYVGHYIQTEVKVMVDKSLSAEESYEIAKQVESNVESIELVDSATVLIEPS